MWHAFRQALRELGYVEGQKIAYEYRYGEAPRSLIAHQLTSAMLNSTPGSSKASDLNNVACKERLKHHLELCIQ
jgi:hypothetical protein